MKPTANQPMETLTFFYHVQWEERQWQYAEVEVTIEEFQIRTIEEDEGIAYFIDFVGDCLAHELGIPIESVNPLKNDGYDQMQQVPTSEWIHREYTINFFTT